MIVTVIASQPCDLATMAFRRRFEALRARLERSGHRFASRDIQEVGAEDALADVYILRGWNDPRQILLALNLRARGAKVGLDLALQAPAEHQAGWARTMAPYVDFLLYEEDAPDWSSGVATHRLRDAIPRPDIAEIASRATSLVGVAQAERVIDVLWSSGGRRLSPKTCERMTDAASWLGRIARAGYRARLFVLIEGNLDADLMQQIARMPIEVVVEPWSPETEKTKAEHCLVRLLATEGGDGVTSEASVGLCDGAQILLPSDQACRDLEGFTYSNALDLIADLEANRLKLRSPTIPALAERIDSLSDPAAQAVELIEFLNGLTNLAARPIFNRVLLVQGDVTDGLAHKFAKRFDALSVASTHAPEGLNYDVQLRRGDGNPVVHLSHAAVAVVAEPIVGLLETAVDDNGAILQLSAIGKADKPQSGVLLDWSADPVVALLELLFPDHLAVFTGSRRLRPTTRAPRQIQPTVAGARGRKRHVAWLLMDDSISSASARYRAFHMAIAMGPEFAEHSFHRRARDLAVRLDDVDVLVVIKRIDLELIPLLARARELGKAVFLDLCDDVLSPLYRRDASLENRVVFAAIAPILAGVVVPTKAMARQIGAHCRADNLPCPRRFVIPDVAETPELFAVASAFAQRKVADRQSPPSVEQHFAKAVARDRVISEANPMRLVWFGNFGSPYSNFGIGSLLAALPALEAAHQAMPIELTVISNSEARFRALTATVGFPTRWVSWTEETIYCELRQADVALLTNGTDSFSDLKSANRALLALAMGLPVIASGNEATRELGAAIVLDDFESGLNRYLGADRKDAIETAIARAKPLLDRFDLPAIGRRWRRLIDSFHALPAEPVEAADDRVLIFVETANGAGALDAALSERPADMIQIMVSLGLQAMEDARIRAILARHAIIPVLVTEEGREEGDRRWLRRASKLLLADKGTISTAFAELARDAGVACRTVGGEAVTVAPVASQIKTRAARGAPVVDPEIPAHYAARPAKKGHNEWLFVTPKESKGWILDAICREIGSRHDGSWDVAYNPKRLPEADNYFFAHYWNYLDALGRQPSICDANLFIWYTHPREIPYSRAQQLDAYRASTAVIFTCDEFRRRWIDYGLSPDKTHVILGGADETLFFGHERGQGVVGLSSSYYERKNPDMVLALVHSMPHRQFHLVGRKWEEYPRFDELMASPNFRYTAANYDQYPEIYGGFDVFVSLATLEGGPIPLLEAMMANVVPVASRTGFAPDLIRHGQNGFLFDIGSTVQDIAMLIDRAFALPTDVRATVIHHNWTNFARSVLALPASAA